MNLKELQAAVDLYQDKVEEAKIAKAKEALANQKCADQKLIDKWRNNYSKAAYLDERPEMYVREDYNPNYYMQHRVASSNPYKEVYGLNADYKMRDDFEMYINKDRAAAEKEKNSFMQQLIKEHKDYTACQVNKQIKNPCSEITLEGDKMNQVDFGTQVKSAAVVDAAQKVEATLSKEITSGISEEVIAYGLVHALSKQAEAIVGQSDLPLIKMTPSMLARIKDHLKEQLKEVESGSFINKEGAQRRLIKFYEAAIALTER